MNPSSGSSKMAEILESSQSKAWGYKWRSSTTYIVACIASAVFAETLLYGFIVPILPTILEERLHVDPSNTQRFTYLVLASYGIVALPSAIVIGLFGDRAKSNKGPLLASWILAIVGTVILASATQLSSLFIGRAFQSIGGTGAWVFGYATLRQSIRGEDMGKIFGFVHGCVSAGALVGPTVAGFLLQMTGYWLTWSAVLVVLVFDIGMRLVMIEKPPSNVDRIDKDETNCHQAASEGEQDETGEGSALLSQSPSQLYQSVSTTEPAVDANPGGQDTSQTSFYILILSQPRVIVGLLSYLTLSSLLAGYEATIPIHVKRTFGWNSLPTGLLFVAIQGPAVFLSPLCGWIRDRIGTRFPTGLGFLLLVPLLWLLGAADQSQFPWANTEASAKATYIVTLIAIGCAQNLLTSVGTVEVTCAVDELESKHPGIFGPNGGYSRSYSLSNISFTAGLLLGPALAGPLTDGLGYYHANSVLAGICVLMSLLAFTFLKGTFPAPFRRTHEVL